jgi:hypothetical protein
MTEPRLITGYEALECLRSAEQRGPQSTRQVVLCMLWGNVLRFLGVRR